MKLETLILNNLLKDEEYLRKVIPFLKDEYFLDVTEKKIFQIINSFVGEYNTSPTKEAIHITLQNDKTLREDEYENITEFLASLSLEAEKNKQWLFSETESFCKDKAVYNAIVSSIQIIDGKNKNLTTDAIPEILKDALSISFDNSVGHDYMQDSDERYDFYHRVEEKIPFDLEFFNKITKGGVPNKTLNIILAGTGVGKSLFMCHAAANCLSQGKNVLYITMEMAEEKIAERIDANLMNVTLDDLKNLPKNMFDDKISRIRNKTQGRLIIKEYPTASAHAGHFRALLNELSLKKDFRPDIIFIDYLNICASSRFKISGNVNSYIYIKGIAEELRGLAVEFNVPIFSATQTTRSGFSNSEIELTDTSESWGLPATADFLFALISTEDLQKLDQIMVKQLKNRYADPNIHKRFVIGVDRAKMKLYDLDMSAQKSLMNDDAPQKKIHEHNKPNVVSSKVFSRNFDNIKI
jgi:replicative DNA helicase